MREISITLKQGTGDAPWIVIRDTDVESARQTTAAVVGLEAGDIPLADLVHNAALHFQRVGHVGAQLGGTVVSLQSDDPAPEQTATTQGQEELREAIANPPAPVEPTLEQQIEKLNTVAELGDLYISNEAAFKGDPELLAKLEAKVQKVK